MEKEYGFVTKRFFPSKQKVSVLTESLGKIDLIVLQKALCTKLWPPMSISFITFKKQNFVYGHDISIEQPNFFTNTNDFLWTHHMVELCNFFVPLESPSNDIYSHIKNSFYLVKKISFLSRNLTEKIKILSIIKFLNLTGYYYTEQIKEALTLFDRLSVLFIDFNNIQKLEFLELQADILPWEYYNKWIIHSLQQHPCFNFFKTVGFLYRGDPW